MTGQAAIWKIDQQKIARNVAFGWQKPVHFQGALPAPRKSTNDRYRSLKYGLKRLAKVERDLEEKRKRQTKRYNKSYPGELARFGSKCLPPIKGEGRTLSRAFSQGLCAGISPDKTQYSAEPFLCQIAE
jgi:hypothetical protein